MYVCAHTHTSTHTHPHTHTSTHTHTHTHTQVLRAMTDGKQLSASLNIDPRTARAREAARLVGWKVGGLAGVAPLAFTVTYAYIC